MSSDASGSIKMKLAVVCLILVAGVFVALGFIFRTTFQAYQPENTVRVTIEVGRGQSPASISRQLEAMQVIRNQKIFLYAGKIRGSWSIVKAGEYELSPSMTTAQIFNILASGISVGRPFLVREGENTFEIADAIEAKGFGKRAEFLKLIHDPDFISKAGLTPPPKSLEGYLYPDTYFFPRKTSVEDIIRGMVHRFTMVWGPNEDFKAKELGFTRDEVITLASMIEKETGAPNERPVISGVFHNRLKKKMRLQSDPTTIYGIWARYRGNIHKSDLLESTPYNTYTVPALPVGPIANPGLEAIRASLNPALHSYLYFVSKNDGTHTFTSTYEDHEKAVSKFQIDRKAREGKSWRDLRPDSSDPLSQGSRASKNQ